MRGKVLGAMLGACALTGVMLTSTGAAHADSTCNPQVAGQYCAVENLRPFWIDEFGAGTPLVTENNSNDSYTFIHVSNQWGVFKDLNAGLCWGLDIYDFGGLVVTVDLQTCDKSNTIQWFEMVPCPHSSWCFYNNYVGTSNGALSSTPQDGADVYFNNTGGPNADNEWQFHPLP